MPMIKNKEKKATNRKEFPHFMEIKMISRILS